MGWFDAQGISGFAPGEPAPSGGGGFDVNPAGAGADPFAYTQGSLLTPWEKKFSYSGPSGGYSAPEIAEFGFGQFNYQAPNVGRIDAMRTDERPDFKFEFSEDDPSYQFRLSQGLKALQNSAAARGNLLTGGTAKAINDYGQQAASQEYQAAYGRAANTYGMNLNKQLSTFDRNWGAQLGAGQANIQAALGEGNLGLQAATAGWDRNYQLARTQWQDQADAAQRAASAGAANGALSYNQALQQYMMERDDFRTNQDRQYGFLTGMAGMGYGAAGQLGNYGAMYGQGASGAYGAAGNAAASGRVGASNALGAGLTGAANAGLGAYYANQYLGGRGGGSSQLPTGYGIGGW
jgi:hypothetical protein